MKSAISQGNDHKKKNISPATIVAKYRISYQTLNYYTNLGLLQPMDKKGNKRYYDEDKLKKTLGEIQKLKNEGYPLRLIRKVLCP